MSDHVDPIASPDRSQATKPAPVFNPPSLPPNHNPTTNPPINHNAPPDHDVVCLSGEE